MPTIRLPLEDKFFKKIGFLDGERYYHKSYGVPEENWEDVDKYLLGCYLYGTKASPAKMKYYYGLPPSYYEPHFSVSGRNTLFAFSKNLKELLPENTYVKSITVNLYLHGGVQYMSSPSNVALSFQNGEPENVDSGGKIYNEKFTSHYFKNGWNEFVFTPDFIDKEAKFRSININIFNDSIHLDRFNYFNREQYYISESEIRNSVIKFDDFNDANPPYAIVEYAFNPPQNADSMAPNNKVINPRTPIRFTWNTKTEQTGFELQYKVNNGGYKTITKSSADRFYVMEPDTITEKSGTVTWRVRFKDESNTYSDYQVATFELGVPEQEPPRIIYPTGSYIKNTESLEFSWAFVSDTIEKQKSFELQYRINNEDWKSVSEETERTNYKLKDIRSFGTSTGQWRVKVANNYDQESDWSEIGKFQVYGVPPRPQIVSVSNKNLPTVKWYSDQQEMFRIRVIDKDNNCIYDSDYILDYVNKEFKIPKVLNNGKYTFALIIKNKYGIDSEKAELTQEIEVINKKEVDFNIFKSDYFLEIVSKESNFSVIRDGKTIGKSDDGSFKDYTGANGKYYKYQIMVESDDEISLSKVIRAKVDFIGCTLATINNPNDFIVLRYNIDNLPGRSLEISINANEIELEGSKYPFIEYGDTVLDQKSYNFFVKDKVKLTNMIEQKEEFLLRDYYGDNICGLIKNIGLNKNKFGYELNFTILRTSDKYE